MIVANTNPVAYPLIPGGRTAEAEAARERDADWRAPLLWRSGLRNVLWTYVRAERLKVEDARATLSDAQGLAAPTTSKTGTWSASRRRPAARPTTPSSWRWPGT